MSESITVRPESRPVHVQVCAVLADGTTLSWELPITSCDTAEITVNRGEAAGGGPFLRAAGPGVDVELVVRAGFRGDLDREGGLYRTDTFGGAPPADVPGKQIPAHHVAMLARVIGHWSPAGLAHRSAHWAQVVRGQATLMGQRLWSEAFLAGLLRAEMLGLCRPESGGRSGR